MSLRYFCACNAIKDSWRIEKRADKFVLAGMAGKKKSGSEKVAKFLYNNIPIREAVVNGKRCNYFRGKKLFEVLLEGSLEHADKPKCESESDVATLGELLEKHG